MPPKTVGKYTLGKPSVYIRIRPEASEGGHAQHGSGFVASAKKLQGWDESTVTVGWTASNEDMGHELKEGQRYDYPKRVIPPEATQDDMYESMMPPLLTKLLGTVEEPPKDVLFFAYGQTGTGKTHTTIGPDASLANACGDTTDVDPRWGCFPRVVFDIFQRLEAAGRPFVVAASAIEMYLMGASDLLTKGPVSVSEKSELVGAKQILLKKPADIIEVLNTVRKNRHTRSTSMNVGGKAAAGEHGGSSRGHAALILTVMQMEMEEGRVAESSFYLVDLAGAERPDKIAAERLSGSEAYIALIKNPENPPLGVQTVFINFELMMIGNEFFFCTDFNKQVRAKSKSKSGVYTLPPYKVKNTCNTPLCQLLGSVANGGELAMVVTLSQAPQCGWETWFSCNYGRSLAQALTPSFLKTHKQVFKEASTIAAASQKIIADTMADIKKSTTEKYNLKRRCLVVTETNRVQLLEALLAKE